MALSKRGDYWYGTTLEDLKTEVVRFSKRNEYEAVAFAPSQCSCGGRHFRLESDETEGVAQRTCSSCGETVLMGDSGKFVADARLESHFCICDSEVFELLSGVALYEGSNDVRWYYIGCRCPECSLVGVYAEWKCEGGDATALLRKV